MNIHCDVEGKAMCQRAGRRAALSTDPREIDCPECCAAFLALYGRPRESKQLEKLSRLAPRVRTMKPWRSHKAGKARKATDPKGSQRRGVVRPAALSDAVRRPSGAALSAVPEVTST